MNVIKALTYPIQRNPAFSNFNKQVNFNKCLSSLFQPTSINRTPQTCAFSSSVQTPSISAISARLLPLYKGSVSDVVEKLASIRVKQLLAALNTPQTEGDTYVQWQRLNALIGNLAPSPIPGTPWDSSETFGAVQRLFKLNPPPLICKDGIINDYGFEQFIQSPTEYAWFCHNMMIPFPVAPTQLINGRENVENILRQCDINGGLELMLHPKHQEMMNQILWHLTADGMAACFFAQPYLKQTNVVVHEDGCFNGQTLQSLQILSLLWNHRLPQAIGTDINHLALTSAQALAEINGLGTHSQYYVANALNPFPLSHLNLNNQNLIRLALRLIPVLSISDVKRFLSILRDSLSSESIAIVSFPLPNGKNFTDSEKANADMPSKIRKEVFSEGVTFKKDYQGPLPSHLQNREFVVNTYLTKEGFQQLAKKHGLDIVRTVTVGKEKNADNHREVSLLKKA